MSIVPKQSEIKSIKVATSPPFPPQLITTRRCQGGAVKNGSLWQNSSTRPFPQPEAFRKAVQPGDASPFCLSNSWPSETVHGGNNFFSASTESLGEIPLQELSHMDCSQWKYPLQPPWAAPQRWRLSKSCLQSGRTSYTNPWVQCKEGEVKKATSSWTGEPINSWAGKPLIPEYQNLPIHELPKIRT